MSELSAIEWTHLEKTFYAISRQKELRKDTKLVRQEALAWRTSMRTAKAFVDATIPPVELKLRLPATMPEFR